MGLVYFPGVSYSAGVSRPRFQGVSASSGLYFNFTSGSLPSGVTLTRASTGTYFDSSGVLQTAATDTARFDYDPATLAPRGLLYEGSLTNLLPYSIPSNNWSYYTGCTFTTGFIAPDGSTSFTKVTVDGTASSSFAQNSGFTFKQNATYSVSAYVKVGVGGSSAGDWLRVALTDNAFTTGLLGWVRLADGYIGTLEMRGAAASGALTTEYIGGGIYRIKLSGIASSTADITYAAAGFSLCTTDGAATRAPNGDNFFAWGIQLEAAAVASSYIATSGAAATRAADLLSVPDTSWFNPTEGTIYAEVEWLGSDTTWGGSLFWFDDGAQTNILNASISDTGIVSGSLSAAGTMVYSNDSSAVTRGSIVKVALAYKNGQNKLYVNGVDLSSGTDFETSGVPSGIDVLLLGHIFNGLGNLNGHYRSFKYWPTQKTATELQQVTT